MSDTIAVRIDAKGRLTLPRELRDELGIEVGDVFFLARAGNVLHLARAENPFDALAEHAREEYRAGATRDLRDFAREHGIRADPA
jgi:bifunctional DNA-binding transcriptional regulator/antitoxin component of YhaV-PrlF toxin-antitoxin module